MELIYINPSYLTIVNERTDKCRDNYGLKSNNELPTDNSHQDNLSKKAKSRMYKCLSWMIYFTNEKQIKVKNFNKETLLKKQEKYGNEQLINKELKEYKNRHRIKIKPTFSYKLGFLTLTLPAQQMHSDNYIREKCLKQFLDGLLRSQLITNYIWKAEKQQNGSIHYHILIDKFIYYNYLQERWNRILEKEGYIEKFRENQKAKFINGFKFDESIAKYANEKVQRARYEKAKSENWSNPNSIDIHAIRKVKNLKSYFTKYMLKENIKEDIEESDANENLKVSSRLWGSNRNLAAIKNVWFYLQDINIKEFRHLYNKFKDKSFSTPFYETILIDIETIIKNGYHSIYNAFRNAIVSQIQNEKKQLFIC